MQTKLTESEMTMLTRIASEAFKRHEAEARRNGIDRIRMQFERQANDALALRDKIENAEAVFLEE
jgi:hypothetical protein